MKTLRRLGGGRFAGALFALLAFYGLNAQPGMTTQAIPDPVNLGAEGGGAYVPGSYVVLQSGQNPSGYVFWELVRYDTTEYTCARVVFTSLPDSVTLGTFGSCGAPDFSVTLPVTSGHVLDESRSLFHHGAFGERVPVGTLFIRVNLTGGTYLDSTPTGAGIWVALWDGEASITSVLAIGVGGNILNNCVVRCAEEPD